MKSDVRMLPHHRYCEGLLWRHAAVGQRRAGRAAGAVAVAERRGPELNAPEHLHEAPAEVGRRMPGMEQD